jgi:hypothetical protein
MTDYFRYHGSCSQASATPPAADSARPNALASVAAALHGSSSGDALLHGGVQPCAQQRVPQAVQPVAQHGSRGSGARVNARARATQSWHAAGIEIGRRWATEAAEPAQLARVAGIEEAELGKLNDVNGWLGALWHALDGGNCPLPARLPEVFVHLFGGEYIRVSQLRGFVDGVRDVRALR